jgi:tRNA-2-methylthio-N6-dimethylallyladenosine synthase
VWHAQNPVPPEVAQDRFRRLVAVQDAAVRAYHERKVGTVVRALVHGPSRKDATKLSAKTTDNVTVNFPTIETAPNPSRPWVDVRVEGASVWGVRGTCIGRAATFEGPADRVAPPMIDLVGSP